MLRLVPVLFAVAACGPGEALPDGGVGDDVDASVGSGGLVFRFSVPAIDQELDDVLITRLRLRMTNLRANGDAGPSLATYREEEDLDLKDERVHEITFEAAPPGRYSAFEFGLERYSDREAAWELEGEIEDDGDKLELRIEDEQSSSLSLPLDLDLAPGETVAIDVTVDLSVFAEDVDWDLAPVQSDEIRIDQDTPLLLAAARAALLASIAVQSITSVR
jgi:hypothetical protein